MHQERKKWETTKSEYVVNDRWLKLRADSCVTPDGHTIEPFYVMEYNDWIVCLILDDDGQVTLLDHYRYGINDYVLELVAGGIDKGETPEAAAVRESEEEVGLVGATFHKVGTVYANPSNQTNRVHCFLALGGTFTGNKFDEPGADFTPVRMSLAELVAYIDNPEHTFQSLHLSGVYFALRYLKRQGMLPAELQ